MAGVARVAESIRTYFLGTRKSNTQSECSLTISEIDTASSHHVLGYVCSVPYFLILIISCTWQQRVTATVCKQSKAFSCFYLGSLLRPLPQASWNTFVLPPSNRIFHSKANPLEHWFNGVESYSIRCQRLPSVYKVTQEKAIFKAGTGSTESHHLPYYQEGGILYGLSCTAGSFTANESQASRTSGPCR